MARRSAIISPRPCPCCFIVPPEFLKHLSQDATIDELTRRAFRESYAESVSLRRMRDVQRVMSLVQRRSSDRLAGAASVEPRIQVFDAEHRQSLPGTFVADPSTSADDATKAVYATTLKVAEFYKGLFGRNSLDRQGIDLVSSVHYRQSFQNAFWDGRQMVYGDGDGEVFAEFFRSPEVIAHELTHGVTQFESGLLYEGESGALNESISDVFAASFKQWSHGWDPSKPEGWRIGEQILGARSRAGGKTCLRDMSEPGSSGSMWPQPASYRDFDPTADVHINSGIPNKAFVTFATSLGSKTWERAAQVWYAACTGGQLPSAATIAQFAARTTAAAAAFDLQEEVAAAWESVDVPFAGMV